MSGDATEGLGFLLAEIVTTMLGGLALFGVYAAWMPKVAADFANAGVELNTPTILMLHLANLTSDAWLIVGPVVLLGPLPLIALPRRHAVRIGAGMIATQLGIALLTIFALYTTYHHVLSKR